MRFLIPLALSFGMAADETPAPNFWTELTAKRTGLPALHQEIKVSELLVYEGQPQSDEWSWVVDVRDAGWREQRVSGWGSKDRYFTGTELITVDEWVGEFLRTRPSGKRLPAPAFYDKAGNPEEVDWKKATEVERRDCGIPDNHTCVLVRIPLVKRIQLVGTKQRRRLDGFALLLADPETGVTLSFATTEAVEQGNQRFSIKTEYRTTQLAFTADEIAPNLSTLREVKTLSNWDAKQLQKSLVGKQAPNLSAVDMQGNSVSLDSLRGKTVLLDFWASWCPPCREDAPALNKLQAKYGRRELVVLGINVAEERSMVEEFLRKHQSKYPIVLSSENKIPRQYQVYAIPTYVIISADGKLSAATDGDKGFPKLKDMLKKAGLDTD